jgi:hypothetical protein
MTIQEKIIAKVRKLPEALAQEVNDFIDFLLVKHDRTRAEVWDRLMEDLERSEAGMGNYLRDLEDYEDRLARGEIRWQS